MATNKKIIKKVGVHGFAWLGALGTAFQNVVALLALKDLLMQVVNLHQAIVYILHTVAVAFGGLCGGIVNACVNIELLNDFFERFVTKKKPTLTTEQNIRYYAVSAIFIVTGLMFGMTAFAFGMTGVLAIVGVVVGVLVSLIMMIQELETWLSSFDEIDNVNNPPPSLWKKFVAYWLGFTPKKLASLTITMTNVIGLSLLFTLGLFCFLTTVGVGALPAVIAAVVVAFTLGAFTEFYFFDAYITKVCNEWKKNWREFRSTYLWGVGLTVVGINAVVNIGLTISGIVLLVSLLSAASIFAPPLGAVLAVAIIAGIGTGVASFILCMKFWTRNNDKLRNLFSKKVADPVEPEKQAGENNSIILKKSVVVEDKMENENTDPVDAQTNTNAETATPIPESLITKVVNTESEHKQEPLITKALNTNKIVSAQTNTESSSTVTFFKPVKEQDNNPTHSSAKLMGLHGIHQTTRLESAVNSDNQIAAVCA